MPTKEYREPLKLYFTDLDGNDIEVSASAEVELFAEEIAKGAVTGLSFQFLPTDVIEIKTDFNPCAEFYAALLGTTAKKYRRIKKLRHIANHTKSGRIRKKAQKSLIRILGGTA